MTLKTGVVVFSVLAIIFLAFAARYTFFYSESWETAECFLSNLRECSRAVFVNDQAEATWKYKIKDEISNECEIEVTLLQHKTNDLELNSLVGKSMTCSLEKGVADYPEKYLDKCHGILKEEMQGVMIKKLHAYLLDNLDEVKEGIGSF